MTTSRERRFEGRVALVSGAARGQGRSHAIRLAQEGASVIGFDLCADIVSAPYSLATPQDLEETQRQVEAVGGDVLTRTADVRSRTDVEAVVAAGTAEFGPIDVVVANAGIIGYGRAWEIEEDDWQDSIDVNLTGVWRTVKAAVPQMIERGTGGSIVITASAVGLGPAANCAHYTAAKTGVLGLMGALAVELAGDQIRVNAVCPTTVLSPMFTNEATYRLFRPDLQDPTLEDAREPARDLTAMNVPWVQPEDVTDAVLYLASDDARYVTGHALPVDAGRLLK